MKRYCGAIVMDITARETDWRIEIACPTLPDSLGSVAKDAAPTEDEAAVQILKLSIRNADFDWAAIGMKNTAKVYLEHGKWDGGEPIITKSLTTLN